MRIISADIFGFGKWVDKKFIFPDQTLICFYGENESGKTTLQQFIIFMLFGFPPRKRATYKPKKSGMIGGRLILYHSSLGKLVIERIDEDFTCYLSDGTDQDEDWFKKQLNEMNEEMYRSIYSFSALDLSHITEMKDESLGEILFSIGLTGAKNIYMIERDIERKIGELFKPTGRVPIINKQLSKLNELHKKSEQYRQKENSYRDKKERQLYFINRIGHLEKALTQLKKELFTYEKYRHILPTIQNYHHYKNELNLLDHKMTFPENGEARFNELKKELIPLQSELELLLENQNEHEQAYVQINNQLQTREHFDTAKQLISEKQNYVENQHLLQQVKGNFKNIELEIKNTLKQLNINLSEKNIKDLSFPFQIEATWIELSRENELLHLEEDQLLEEEHILMRKKNQLNNEESILSQKLLPDEQIQTLREKLARNEQMKIQVQDQNARKNEWKKTKVERLKNAKTISYYSLAFAIICLIVGAISNFKILFIVMGLSLIIGLGQQYMTNRSVKEMEQFIKNQSNLSDRPERLPEKEHRQIAKLIEEHEKYKNELYLIKQTKKSVHIDELKWEERKQLFQQKITKHERLVDEQQAKFPFLKHVSVPHWLDLLEALKGLQEKIMTKNKLEKKLLELDEGIIKFTHRVKHFIESIGMIEKKDILENNTLIEELEAWIQNERDLLRQKKQYGEFLRQNKNKQNQLNKEISYYEGEMNELFQIAGAKSEEHYFEVANTIQKRQELLDKKQTCFQQISLTFSGEDMERVIEQTINESDIDLSIEMLVNKVAKTEQKINEKRDSLAEVEALLNQMETSDYYSEIIHQIEIEEEKLSALIFEWAILQTSKTALDKSKRAYRNKYLKEVITKTSTYFSLITNGAYKKVFQPTTSEPFLVQSYDYTRYDVNELSKGTIDQLYVSLRLAISEVMSERYNVPFIIDDAFVHFDSKRMKNVVKILLEIGKTQQVILFTCREDVRQLIPAKMVIQINEPISVH